jgi:hypothetical protein
MESVLVLGRFVTFARSVSDSESVLPRCTEPQTLNLVVLVVVVVVVVVVVAVLRVCYTPGDPVKDFLGKVCCSGVVCHCLLLCSFHICAFPILRLFLHQLATFFLSCTVSVKASKRRPVAPLTLSSHHNSGFPCLLCPATCPSIMSRSSDPFALIKLLVP